ncbi:MAG: SDR family oxidoreductase [Planctomycetota bacterium]
MDDEGNLAGQWAVVTGSSSGIGRAIAEELASCGANVVVHGNVRVAEANSVAANIREMGGSAEVVIQDLAEPAGCDALVDRIWSLSPADIWINNAGLDVLTGEMAKLSFEEKFAQLWPVDVAATIRLSRAVGDRMKTRGSGTILNIGWDQAATGMEGESGEMFAATKGSVMAFTRSLAKSLGPEVRVNCIAPGWIKTQWGAEASEYWQQRAVDESILNRWGTPDDIARAARFLVSPDARFITGQILNVNGGQA